MRADRVVEPFQGGVEVARRGVEILQGLGEPGQDGIYLIDRDVGVQCRLREFLDSLPPGAGTGPATLVSHDGHLTT